MTFGPDDMRPLQVPHNDPLVVQLKIATALVRRVLIDTESSVDIITLECFKKLHYSEEDLEVTNTPLVGFGGQPIYPRGVKKLTVRVGEKDNSRIVDVNFLVADVPMAYNVIIGHPTLSMLKAVVAPYLLLMQFELDDRGVGKLFGDQRMARECYYVSLKSLGRKEEAPVTEVSRPSKSAKKGDPEAVMTLLASAEDHGQSRPEPTVEIEEIPLDDNRPDCVVRIGHSLAPTVKATIVTLLRQYQDVFAFEPSEMPRIAPEIIQYKLNVDPSHKPVIQKRRHLGVRAECSGGR